MLADKILSDLSRVCAEVRRSHGPQRADRPVRRAGIIRTGGGPTRGVMMLVLAERLVEIVERKVCRRDVRAFYPGIRAENAGQRKRDDQRDRQKDEWSACSQLLHDGVGLLAARHMSRRWAAQG